MPETKQRIVDFLGKTTNVADPPGNTAQLQQNFVRYRKRGQLEQAPGYAPRWTDGLPQTTNSGIPTTYLNPAINKISNLAWENIGNFYVPDHGGANIALAIGTYTKTGFFTGNPTVNRVGVFARPFWNGSTWLDQWIELTEMFIFDLLSIETGTGSTPTPTTFVPATFTSDNPGGSYSDQPWLTPNAAQCGSGSAASAHLNEGGANNSQYLLSASQRIICPAGSTVTGITVNITRRCNNAALNVNDYSVVLQKNGTLGSSDRASATLYTTSDVVETYGSGSDLWGLTFNNGDEIAVAIASHAGSTAAYAYVDCVQIIITYGPITLTNMVISTPSQYNFNAADPTGKVFNTTYFKNWTVVYNSFHDYENYDLIQACGYDGSGNYYLQPNHPITDYADSVSVGAKLIVYRNFQYKDLPATLVSWLYNILAEGRLTTGNGTSDISMLQGFRTKQFANAPAIDRLLSDTAVFDFWPYITPVAINGSNPNANGIPAGTYYLKYCTQMDDGSYTSLTDCWTASDDTGGNLIPGNSITLSTPSNINLNVFASLGALPRRAQAVVVFMSSDGIDFDQVQTFPLTIADGAVNTSAQLVFLNPPAPAHNIYHLYSIIQQTLYTDPQITGTLWAAPGPEASALIGRAINDPGIIQYQNASVINAKTWAVGVNTPTGLLPNAVMTTPFTGEPDNSNSEYDVFPDETTFINSLDVGDGDILLGVVNLNNNGLAFKKRSIWNIYDNGDGTYTNQLITAALGCCSIRTVIGWQNAVLWMDYNGAYVYAQGTNPTLINAEWQQDWKNLTTTQKEAAIGILDRVNHLWRVCVPGIEREFVYELDGPVTVAGQSRAGHQWMDATPQDVPARYAVQEDGSMDFLSPQGPTGNVFTWGTKTQQNGENFSMLYTTNPTEPNVPLGMDAQVKRFFFKWNSTIPITINLYLDDNPTAVGTFTLPAGTTQEASFWAPLQSRCKQFYMQIEATTQTEGDYCQLTEMSYTFDAVPQGGDNTQW